MVIKSKTRLQLLPLVGAALILHFDPVEATIINAKSGSYSDVSAAVRSTSPGDVVQIPPGTNTWTSSFWLTNAITLVGAGVDQTVIIDEVPRSGQYLQVFILSAPNGQNIRLSGMTIRGGTVNTTVNYDGEILVVGTTKSFRIDHIKFDGDRASGIEINGPVGVIDHCLFNSYGVQGIIVFHSSWNGASFGDGSWADGDWLGSGNAVCIEDNTFLNNNYAGALDSCKGGRLIFRYNTLTNTFIGNHGTESTQRYRSVRAYEIYGNTAYWDPAAPNAPWPFPVYLRGGTGVLFSNTFLGNFGGTGITVANYRNTTNPEGYPWPPWGPAQNAKAGVDGPNVWDQNSDTTGYACIDQVGRGAGDLLSGGTPVNTTTGTAAWPHQALSPVYQWANTINGNPVTIGSQTPNIKPNRDWYDSTPKPGYTPFTYPHPLITGAAKPPAPGNLRVVSGP
jgi:hypothetical protein